MSLDRFCHWLVDTPGSIALHESLYMYTLIESTHVLTLCVFVGMSVMLDLRLLGTDGDHNTAGLKATAMRLVNAIPAVVAAPPGLLTALDLPLITGRGLVR